MKTTKDYKAIRRWGNRMGSMNYYIEDEQAKALEDDAPITAIYRRNGVWSLAEDIVEDDLREFILKGDES